MHGKTTKVFAKYQKLLSWLAPNAFLTLFEAPGSQMPKVLQPKFITFCPWSKPLRSVLVGVSSTQLSRLETFENCVSGVSWFGYLVHDLGNCLDATPTETGLIVHHLNESIIDTKTYCGQ